MWLKIRILPRRIGFQQQDNLHLSFLFVKIFESGPTQSLLPNRRTSARIADTRSLKEKIPWTTVVDHLLFLEGWSRRNEYGSRTHLNDIPASGSCTRHIQISRPTRRWVVLSSVSPNVEATVLRRLSQFEPRKMLNCEHLNEYQRSSLWHMP